MTEEENGVILRSVFCEAAKDIYIKLLWQYLREKSEETGQDLAKIPIESKDILAFCRLAGRAYRAAMPLIGELCSSPADDGDPKDQPYAHSLN